MPLIELMSRKDRVWAESTIRNALVRLKEILEADWPQLQYRQTRRRASLVAQSAGLCLQRDQRSPPYEAAQARQKFLIHNATPSELKAEARYQSATERDIAVQEEAQRRHEFVLSQQQHYPALPSTNADGEIIDAAYLRKISTINFPLFKQLVKKHGGGHVTARLRGQN